MSDSPLANDENPFTTPESDLRARERNSPSEFKPNELPLLKSARREALIAFGIWAAATAYSVGYCCQYGYNRDVASLTFVMGFPDWVFWGLVVPWGVSTIVASLFAFFIMKDEDLETSAL